MDLGPSAKKNSMDNSSVIKVASSQIRGVGTIHLSRNIIVGIGTTIDVNTAQPPIPTLVIRTCYNYVNSIRCYVTDNGNGDYICANGPNIQDRLWDCRGTLTLSHSDQSSTPTRSPNSTRSDPFTHTPTLPPTPSTTISHRSPSRSHITITPSSTPSMRSNTHTHTENTPTFPTPTSTLTNPTSSSSTLTPSLPTPSLSVPHTNSLSITHTYICHESPKPCPYASIITHGNITHTDKSTTTLTSSSSTSVLAVHGGCLDMSNGKGLSTTIPFTMWGGGNIFHLYTLLDRELRVPFNPNYNSATTTTTSTSLPLLLHQQQYPPPPQLCRLSLVGVLSSIAHICPSRPMTMITEAGTITMVWGTETARGRCCGL